MREMKESGLEWIKKIPKEWEVNRIKYLFKSTKGLSITKENLIEEGLPVISYGQIHSKMNTGVTVDDDLCRFVSYDYSKYKSSKIEKFDFAFADTSEDYEGCGNCVYKRTDDELYGGYHVVILKSVNKKDNRYFAYLFQTDAWRAQIRTKVSGVKVYSITQKIINEASVIIPPVQEQKRIANFLDVKCTEIDELAADIQAQIETLEQYKRSIISETVIKGLNPDVEMKDSGVQWISNMPSHWEVIRGKYILRYMQKPVREDDGVVTCFRDGEVTLRSNRREDGFTMSDKEIGYQGIDIGDLVVHGMDGFAGAIGISDSRGKASPVLNVLDTNQNKRYIMYYLRSMAYNNVFLALATGIRVRSCDLRWNKLAGLSYPVPPLDEQKAIVEHIDAVLEKADTVISDKKEQLTTLEEYKKSLIFEYVTGKKEVSADV